MAPGWSPRTGAGWSNVRGDELAIAPGCLVAPEPPFGVGPWRAEVVAAAGGEGGSVPDFPGGLSEDVAARQAGERLVLPDDRGRAATRAVHASSRRVRCSSISDSIISRMCCCSSSETAGAALPMGALPGFLASQASWSSPRLRSFLSHLIGVPPFCRLESKWPASGMYHVGWGRDGEICEKAGADQTRRQRCSSAGPAVHARWLHCRRARCTAASKERAVSGGGEGVAGCKAAPESVAGEKGSARDVDRCMRAPPTGTRMRVWRGDVGEGVHRLGRGAGRGRMIVVIAREGRQGQASCQSRARGSIYGKDEGTVQGSLGMG